MTNIELRNKLSYHKLAFRTILSTKGKDAIYLIKPTLGYHYYITAQKKSLGFISTYRDLASFTTQDVVGYINEVADYSGLGLREIFETDLYLNNEATHYFEKVISLDEYGYYHEGPGKVRIYTNDHLMWSYDSDSFVKSFYIKKRIEEIMERKVSNYPPDITPPWAFEM